MADWRTEIGEQAEVARARNVRRGQRATGQVASIGREGIREVQRMARRQKQEARKGEQGALAEMREQTRELGRQADLPGRGHLRQQAKRVNKSVPASIARATSEIMDNISEAEKETIHQYVQWMDKEKERIQGEVEKAIAQVDKWEADNIKALELAEKEYMYAMAAEAQRQVESMKPYSDAKAVMAPYKKGGRYNLVKASRSGDAEVHRAMELLFPSMRETHGANWVERISKKAIPAERYYGLPEELRVDYKPVFGLTTTEWTHKLEEINKLATESERQMASTQLYDNYYWDYEPIPISGGAYAELSDEVKPYYTPQLSAWETLTPWKEEKGETFGSYGWVKGVATMGSELLVPFVYTVRHWGDMKGWEKGVGLVMDIASFIPGVNIASSTARAGKGTLRAIGTAVIAEVKAPITSALHPIATAKSVVTPFEAILHPRAVPLASTEIRFNTVKIPRGEIGSAKSAMQARDRLVDLAIQGKGATITQGGKQFTLTPTALQKTIGGALVHSTPDVRAFMNGAELIDDLFVAPNVHTRFTISSSKGVAGVEGAIPGALIIRDPRLVAKASYSGKTYRKWVEIEKTLGKGERIPPPSQVLFTRDASGRKMALLIVGEPLSPGEIAKLKILGVKDTVRDIFAPQYTARQMAGVKNMDELIETQEAIQHLEDEIRALRADGPELERVAKLEKEIIALEKDARRLSEEVARAYTGQKAMMPIGVGQGEYIKEAVMNEYAEKTPDDFARALNEMPSEAREEALNLLGKSTRRDIHQRMRRVTGRAPSVLSLSRAGVRIDQRVASRVGVDRATRSPERGRVGGRDRAGRTVGRTTGRTVGRTTGRTHGGRDSGKTIPRQTKTDSGAGEDRETRRRMAPITWRQGLFWVTVYPPYRGKKDMTFTREKPKGSSVATGPRSAYETIKKLGVETPEKVFIDMGIMDVHIEKHGEAIKFRPDKKQQTTLGYPKGMPQGVGVVREK